MCGIAGKAFFKNNKFVEKRELELMSSKIAHRGPDDEGIYLSPNKSIGFATRRLAIIDLSKKGHQPMRYNNRYVITFNGEIYNFKSEKEKLEKEGYIFRSNSDTEVILALYSRYKIKFLNHLRGMFALAIYDEIEQILILARDRIGKKPLKYILDENGITFASELKAILVSKNVKAEPDYEAIQKYLLYGYVPSPFTGFKNIKKLEPGTYMVINLKNKSVIKRKYWQPIFKNKLQLTEKEWSRRILDTLDEATKIRMISDVPIGSFLSGGVDSSAVTAFMAMNSKNSINTFSILFENKKYSEKKYADKIVERYKTNHTEIIAKPTSLEILPEIAKMYEEPFGDNSTVVSYLVSKAASKKVTVVLNGDGGDELFAGYPNRYLRLKRDVDFEYWITKIRPAAALGIKKLTNFIEKSKLPLFERFASYNSVFSPLSLKSCANPYQEVEETFKHFSGYDIKDAGLKFDQLYFLPDQLLTKMDIATMANSLEARSPLLDHKMIELANKIPFNLKVKGRETKYIFKKSLEQIVPKENLYRPKVGFTIPLDDWFKEDLGKFYNKIIKNKKSIYRDYLKDTKNFTNQQKWVISMLCLWYESYF